MFMAVTNLKFQEVIVKRMEELVFILNQGPTNFNKFGNHLEILGTRRVT
jgi:hypothetical protein